MADHQQRLERHHHFVVFDVIADQHQDFLGSHGKDSSGNTWACRSLHGSPNRRRQVITDYYGQHGFLWRGGLPPLGCEAPPTFRQLNRAHRFCDCCAAERGKPPLHRDRGKLYGYFRT
ncbi:hypothetical protein FQ192_02590 [Pseudomonas sp. ANT_J12]|nr:hypothetical protein FQ192_02590 [Pseudomonas sp. ANT_J12]